MAAETPALPPAKASAQQASAQRVSASAQRVSAQPTNSSHQALALHQVNKCTEAQHVAGLGDHTD